MEPLKSHAEKGERSREYRLAMRTGRSRRKSNSLGGSERERSAVNPSISSFLHLIQWVLQSVYAFLEHGTVRVPGETSVPESIAVVLVRNLIAYRNF